MILLTLSTRPRACCPPPSLPPSLPPSPCMCVWVCGCSPYVRDSVSGVLLQSKIFIGSKGDIAQFASHQKVPLAIAALTTYMRATYLRVCPSACVRSGARVAHATSAPRPCAMPQHGQTAVGFRPARRRRSGSIDRLQALLQASQVGIFHHGQGVCCELLMNVYMCVCVCVCVCACACVYDQNLKDRTKKNESDLRQTVTVTFAGLRS